MKVSFSPLFISLSLCLLAPCLSLPIGAATLLPSHEEVLDCEALLDSAKNFTVTIHRLFAKGLNDTRRTVAYAPMSSQELVELVNHGDVQSKTNGFNLYLLQEYPGAKKLIQRHPGLRLGPLDSQTQLGGAQIEAWEKSVAQLLAKRIEALGRQPHIDMEVLGPFLSNLKSQFQKAEMFSPSFRNLTTAARTLEIPYSEPTISDTNLDPRLQKIFNIGERYWELVGHQKLASVAKLLGLPVGNLTPANDQKRMELVQLFKNLPRKAGVVVGFRSSALKRVHWDPEDFPKLQRFTIHEITGIEPNSDADYFFLDRLKSLNR